MRIVAEVREATAEIGVFYGAEFTGGTDTALLEPAAQRQIALMKSCRNFTFKKKVTQ